MKEIMIRSAFVLCLIVMGTGLLITSCSRPMNPPPSKEVDQGTGVTGTGVTGTGTTSSGPLDSEMKGTVKGSSPGSKGGEVR